MENIYTVIIVSGGGVRHELTSFETEKEAEKFCDEYEWRWIDENGFEWYLDID